MTHRKSDSEDSCADYDDGVPVPRSPDVLSRAASMPEKRMSLLESLKTRVKRLEAETYALYLAYKDPRTPWYAKAVAAFVVAHTVSPIDLIPDFIPVLGYLDDLVITPLGIVLALKLIPPEVIGSARARAALAASEGRINTRAGIAIVVSVWVLGAAVLAALLLGLLRPP